MNKSEIQERIEKCESELATLKADLAKCDCTDGIEQERCWHAVTNVGGVITTQARTKQLASDYPIVSRPAYMPECRKVTADDVSAAYDAYCYTTTAEQMARKLHKLGFRMKVTP